LAVSPLKILRQDSPPKNAATWLCRDFTGNHFIHVTPNPIFAGFDRAHHRMRGLVKMFGGVLVLGRIAATHVSAYHAQAQVNPSVAEFYALRANVGVGARDFDLIEMVAFLWHRDLPLISIL
jgi:hypothetical protein